MIPVNKLVEVFYTMLGWPYASPGTNGSAGIDCSGAFVYAYKQFGERIYHGSNRIVRVYCHDVRRVTSASQLRVGDSFLFAGQVLEVTGASAVEWMGFAQAFAGEPGTGRSPGQFAR